MDEGIDWISSLTDIACHRSWLNVPCFNDGGIESSYAMSRTIRKLQNTTPVGVLISVLFTVISALRLASLAVETDPNLQLYRVLTFVVSVCGGALGFLLSCSSRFVLSRHSKSGVQTSKARALIRLYT